MQAKRIELFCFLIIKEHLLYDKYLNGGQTNLNPGFIKDQFTLEIRDQEKYKVNIVNYTVDEMLAIFTKLSNSISKSDIVMLLQDLYTTNKIYNYFGIHSRTTKKYLSDKPKLSPTVLNETDLKELYQFCYTYFTHSYANQSIVWLEELVKAI